MGNADGGAAYRKGAADEESVTVIAAPTGSVSAKTAAIVITLASVVLCAIPLVAAGADRQAWLILIIMLVVVLGPLDLWLFVIARNTSRVCILASSREFTVRATTRMGSQARPFRVTWKELRSVEPLYVGPSAGAQALRVAAVVVAGRAGPRQQPTPHVLFTMKEGEELVCTNAFSFRPEVIARRIARFRRQGADTVRATDAEIAAHRDRFKEPHLLPGRFFGRSPFVKLTRDGIHAGRSEGGAKLYVWDRIVSAHVLPATPPYHRMIQVELTDGTALNISPRPAVPDDEVAELLAPRYFPGGSERERSNLDLPVESKRELFWGPDEKKKKKKKKKPRVDADQGS
jgi:hypothetical protein